MGKPKRELGARRGAMPVSPLTRARDAQGKIQCASNHVKHHAPAMPASNPTRLARVTARSGRV